MKRTVLLAALLSLVVVSIAYAQKDPSCPNCSYIQTWSGTLAQNGSVTYAANVTGGVYYRAELLTNASGMTLTVLNNATLIDCWAYGTNKICEYKAVSSGVVNLRVYAASGGNYSLYHLLRP
jgi:hypothetical protein